MPGKAWLPPNNTSMIPLIFATHNAHKAAEIQQLVPASIKIITLAEAGMLEDIPEPYPTLQENAATKATTIFSRTQSNCFGEDSGLLVASLNNQPGVLSARYAGDHKSTADNNALLLRNMEGIGNRAAKFVTVIALHWQGQLHFFTGECTGTIGLAPKGEQGFGYDPLFTPDGSTKTFAEMDSKEKAVYSHRAKATQQLIAFLHQYSTTHA